MSIIEINNPSKINNVKLSPHFMAREFMCNHCHTLILDDRVVYNLETAREMNGNYPMNITSGYRCPVHNSKVGGSRNSLHKYGKAVDFDMFNRLHGLTIFDNTVKIFNRVGFYKSRFNKDKSYIHADVGTKKLYWLSYYDVYKKKRVYIYFTKLNNFYTMVNKDTEFNWKNLII